MAQYLLTIVPARRSGARRRRSWSRSWRDVDARRPRRCATAGVWVFAGGLHAADDRHGRSAPTDGDVLVTDGPYAEGKEHVGGFTIIEVAGPGRRAGVGPQARPRHARCRSRCGRSGDATPVTAGDRAVFREHYGRAVAVLVRLLGDIDAAEEAVQDAFAHRRRSAGRSTASRRARPAGSSPPPATGPSTGCAGRAPARDRHAQAALLRGEPEPEEEGPVHDDRLRLIFTCCHPALAVPAQVALTLRLLGGLTTAEIARGVPGARADDGAAAGAGEGQDPRRPHPVPGADRGRAARPAARRARRRLPDLHRGPPGDVGRRGWSARTSAPRRSGSAGCWPS